jgi:transposase
MTTQASSDLKVKAVKHYHKVNNYAEVCKIFECSERSLKRWVERYGKNKNVDRKPRQQGSYKINKEHIKFIKDTLKKDNDIHIKVLYLLLKNKFPDLDISRQYIHDLIRDNNITRKRATFEHFPLTYRGEPRDEKAELKAFFKEIKKFSLDNIISIDETSVSTSLGFNYCRNDLGKRCIIKTDDNAVFTKYSLVVAITNNKCIGYTLYQKGSVNSDRFNEFIQDICDNVKNKLIILDNGQIHKKESTRKIIKDSENFLLYTCPYHPRLNAIENFFNQMKHYLKLYKSKNYNELTLNLKKSIKNIKKDHYKNYFIYAYNKDYYKNKQTTKKSSKHRKPKIYKD